LLFGGAVVVIILAALSLPWIRMNALVREGELALSRQMADTWLRLDGSSDPDRAGDPEGARAGIHASRLDLDEARRMARDDPFIARALRAIADEGRTELLRVSRQGTAVRYRYARAIDEADPVREGERRLAGILVLDRFSAGAAWQLLINAAYVYGAGVIVLCLAVLMFYIISNRLILSPVRSLKRTAELVREGNLSVRSTISTGDEYEELAEAFNSMLFALEANEGQLRATNKALDLKLNQIAEASTALYEAARLKTEFVASVSHELRTPLNSIIGFGELLLEIAHKEVPTDQPTPEQARRMRYLDNIVVSSRNLLEMINGLLDMARIEAGKVDLRVEPMSLHEACEGIFGLIQPLAMEKRISLKLDVRPDVPIIETDVRLFGQIIFNFVSNAVKFLEPRRAGGGPCDITLRAERLVDRTGDEDRVRVSVIDTGPGITPDQQQRIFQKFEQGDSGLTRQSAGTGLGLAIAKEFAALIHGEIQLVSEIGRGSMFSLIVPVKLDPQWAAEARLESTFRGVLAGRREETDQ